MIDNRTMNFTSARSALKTVTCLTALALLLPAQAQAQNTPSFEPTSPWKTESSVATGGAGKNCAVSAQYDNGFIINMGGVDGKTEIVGVNFRQNVFEAGKTYNVNIAVPGVMDSPAAGTAINASTLGIGIAAQNAFYDGIKAARVFDLSVEGNDFRFQLKNFGNAAMFLDTCQSESAPAAPATPTAVMQVSRAPEPETINDTAQEPKIVAAPQAEPEPQAQETASEPPQSLVQPQEDAAAPEAQFEMKEANTLATVSSSPATPTAMQRPTSRKRFIDQLDASMRGEEPDMPSEKDLIKPPQDLVQDFRNDVANKKAEADAAMAMAMDIAPVEAKAPAPPPEQAAAMKAEAAPKAPAIAKVSTPVLNTGPQERPTAPPNSAAAKTAPPEREGAPEDNQSNSIVMNDKQGRARIVMTPEPDEVVEEAFLPGSSIRQTTERRKMEADFTDLAPPAVPPVPVSRSTMASTSTNDDLGLRKHMRELEEKVSALESENKQLESELEFSLESSKDERASIADQNWDLERATMLYHEAENQIKHLGMQLQKERARHEQEVRELEMMLFDPAVTSQQQLAKLAALEAELAAHETKMADQRRIYEERIRILESQSAAN